MSKAEAFCLMFSKSPSWENFKILISSPDIMEKMMQYDVNFVSDYVINKLEKYVSMSDFRPENISSVSQTASAICGWILAVYNYSTQKASVYIRINSHFYFYLK